LSAMDRRVKERLIGASILVAIAVLVVPELLSGPRTTGPVPLSLPAGAPEPIRTVTVDLATSKTSPPSATPESSAPGAAPPSPGGAGATPPLETAAPFPKSSSAASVAAPATQAATTTSATPATPAPTSATAPTATQAAPSAAQSASAALAPAPAASHGWAVQLGSFASLVNAEKLLGQLKAQGYLAYVSSTGVGTSERYRVRVGPLSDRETAAHTAAKLKDAGHSATLVPPAP